MITIVQDTTYSILYLKFMKWKQISVEGLSIQTQIDSLYIIMENMCRNLVYKVLRTIFGMKIHDDISW